MGALGLVEKLLVEVDHSALDIVDSPFTFVDSQYQLYPLGKLAEFFVVDVAGCSQDQIFPNQRPSTVLLVLLKMDDQ